MAESYSWLGKTFADVGNIVRQSASKFPELAELDRIIKRDSNASANIQGSLTHFKRALMKDDATMNQIKGNIGLAQDKSSHQEFADYLNKQFRDPDKREDPGQYANAMAESFVQFNKNGLRAGTKGGIKPEILQALMRNQPNGALGATTGEALQQSQDYIRVTRGLTSMESLGLAESKKFMTDLNDRSLNGKNKRYQDLIIEKTNEAREDYKPGETVKASMDNAKKLGLDSDPETIQKLKEQTVAATSSMKLADFYDVKGKDTKVIEANKNAIQNYEAYLANNNINPNDIKAKRVYADILEETADDELVNNTALWNSEIKGLASDVTYEEKANRLDAAIVKLNAREDLTREQKIDLDKSYRDRLAMLDRGNVRDVRKAAISKASGTSGGVDRKKKAFIDSIKVQYSFLNSMLTKVATKKKSDEITKQELTDLIIAEESLKVQSKDVKELLMNSYQGINADKTPFDWNQVLTETVDSIKTAADESSIHAAGTAISKATPPLSFGNSSNDKFAPGSRQDGAMKKTIDGLGEGWTNDGKTVLFRGKPIMTAEYRKDKPVKLTYLPNVPEDIKAAVDKKVGSMTGGAGKPGMDLGQFRR